MSASQTSSLLDRGIFLGNNAVQLDRAACTSPDDADLYRRAKQAYIDAVEAFREVVQHTSDRTLGKQCHDKLKEYLSRAEMMNQWLVLHNVAQGKQGEAKGSSSKITRKTPVSPRQSARGETVNADDSDDEDDESQRMRRALLAAVVTEKPNVKWSDVAGLAKAKEALSEAVVLPQKFPNMFVGARQPWRGILLYGPPGTGKSFLAKAVATEVDSYFIAISSSDLVSKWQGDSEKLVKELFKLAQENAPSVVFIDEIDALVSTRSDSESESSRRIKTEFLVQMDGVNTGADGVLVLGATNIPWGLDDALLRRMERRIHIPLPNAQGRAQILRIHVGDTPHELTEEDFRELGASAEGYSGSDLKTVCRDAIMQPVRIATTATHFKKIREGGEEKFTPCSPGDGDAQEVPGGLLKFTSQQLALPLVTRSHFEAAFANSKPSVGPEILKSHMEFTRTRGQQGM